MTAGRLEAMKKAIVGLVMTVEEVEGSFKLNQHKSDADHVAIAAALAAQADAAAQAIGKQMVALRPQLDYKSPSLSAKRAGWKERAMTLSDTKQPKGRTGRRRPRSPPCSSTARPERRASAFASASACRTTSR